MTMAALAITIITSTTAKAMRAIEATKSLIKNIFLMKNMMEELIPKPKTIQEQETQLCSRDIQIWVTPLSLTTNQTTML